MPNIISLNEAKTNQIFTIAVQVGDILNYGGLVHASVGFFIEYVIENEAVIAYKDFQQTFHFPEKMKLNGITSADESTGIYIFEAIAKGSSFIKIQHQFRGETENEFVFNIIVG